MLKVDDIRDTRVYKEAMEEGREEIRQLYRQQRLHALLKMGHAGIAPEDIADCLGLDLELVKRELATIRD